MPQYVGIADAHGLDSFVPWTNLHAVSSLLRDNKDKAQLSSLYFRAMANKHRHALVYRVKLSEEDAKDVQELFDTGKYVDALRLMKVKAEETEIEKNREKSWNMIPNPDLDPYS